VPDTLKKDWILTPEAFELLLALLDENREEAGKKYEELRSALEKFFEWRGARFSEELADETLDRAARKIAAGEVVRSLHHYCIGVARLVLLEAFKRRTSDERGRAEFARSATALTAPSETVEAEQCLTHCLDRLQPDNRELVIRYYDGDGGAKAVIRRSLSERFRLPGSALRMRVLRLREALELCVSRCLKSKKV